MYKTPESRWRAVQIRDRAAASAFVYAVTTTHIFCRPVCPARLARRANVKFFDTSAEATAAQFRPCKRCKPQDSQSAEPAAKKVVEAACARIREQHGQITLDALAKHLHISPRYLHHIFSKNVGCTPATYAAKFKSKPEQSRIVQQNLSQLQSLAASNTNSNSNTDTNNTTSIASTLDHSAIATDTSIFIDSPDQWGMFEDGTISPTTWSDLENMDTTTTKTDEMFHMMTTMPPPLPPLLLISSDIATGEDVSWQMDNNNDCSTQEPLNFWDFADFNTDYDPVLLLDSDFVLPTVNDSCEFIPSLPGQS